MFDGQTNSLSFLVNKLELSKLRRHTVPLLLFVIYSAMYELGGTILSQGGESFSYEIRRLNINDGSGGMSNFSHVLHNYM